MGIIIFSPKKTNAHLMKFLDADESYIRIPLNIVNENQDFKDHAELFFRIDKILSSSGIEKELIEKVLHRRYQDLPKLNPTERADQYSRISQGLRINIVKQISGLTCRKLAIRMVDSRIYSWFCQLDTPKLKKSPAKTKINDLEKMIPESDLRDAIQDLACYFYGDAKDEINENVNIFVDATCIELNIHHPVDWVLLKDMIFSIMTTLASVRKHGVLHRMDNPKTFKSEANKLSIAMTHCDRGKKKHEGLRARKKTFKALVKLLRRSVVHAINHCNKLAEHWSELTDLSEKQAQNFLDRLNEFIELSETIIDQASERLLKGETLSNEEKVLSLYEPHAKVYKRGKARGDTEFGLQLTIAETQDGMIINWDIHDQSPKPDYQYIEPCIHELQVKGLKPASFCGDRGLYTKKTEEFLESEGVRSYNCPKDITVLRERVLAQDFKDALARRAQTEARISIFKNKFLKSRLTTKGFENQKLQIAWSMLSHNLWVAARRLHEEEVSIVA